MSHPRQESLSWVVLILWLLSCQRPSVSPSPSSVPAESRLLQDTSASEEAALRLPPKFMLILPQDLTRVQVGDRLPLSCLAEFPYSVRKDISSLVRWTVDREERASIDAQGVLSILASGELNVSAEYRGLISTRKLILSERTVRQVLIFPQDLSLELPAKLGGYETRTFLLEAYGLFSDGELTDLSQECNWTWKGGSGVSPLSKKGEFRVSEAGTFVFTAKCQNFSAERSVSVRYGEKQAKTIVVPEAPLVMSKGESRSFSVVLTYSDGSTATVTGEAELSGGATLVVRQGNALQSLSTGNTHLLVRHSGLTTELPVHVSPARPTALRFQPSGYSIQVGTQFPLRVYADLSDGSSEEVTSSAGFRSLAVNTFQVLADSPTLEGLQAGTGQVEASYKGLTATAPVVVGSAVLDKLIIEPDRLEVVAGLSTTYRVWGRMTDQQLVDLTSVAQAVPLSLTRAEVPAGQRGQLNGKSQGSTSLSVSYIDPDGRNLTASAPLNVLAPQLVSMSLEPAEASVALGRIQEFRVRGLYTDQSEQDLTDKVEVMANVTSPYAPVARILFTSSGRIRLQSTAEGSMQLLVKFGNISDSSLFTVTEKVLEDLYIQRLNASGPQGQIYKNQTARFRAIAVFSDQTTVDVTASGTAYTSTWNVPPASRASFVDDNGEKLFTAISEGDAQFSVEYASATRGNRSATFNIGVYTLCSSPGFVDGYYCYYLGSVGESCTASCSAVSRVPHPATLEAIGSQASNSETCSRVLTKGFPTAMTNFNIAATASAGIGCSIFTLADLNLGLRESNRITTYDASTADFRRVCACQ